MPLQGITSLYAQTTAGQTGAGALESREGLPGYGPSGSPYGQDDHGRWGDLAGAAYAAPGWNATLQRSAQDAYAGDWVLADETEYEGQDEGSASELPNREPSWPPTTVTGYAGRGRYHGYELGTAAAEGPENHAGPYPRSWTGAGRLRPEPGTQLDDQWTEQEARRITHEGGYGADVPPVTGPAEPQFGRRDVYYTSQGETLLAGNLPAQLMFAGGGPAMGHRAGQHGPNSDTVQGGGTTNDYGYGAAHVQNYRQQTDGVPFNYQWLDASERPFIPKGQLTNAAAAQTLDGPDSPYGAMGDQTDYSAATFGPAMVESPATPYAQPPDPTMAPSAPAGDDGDEWAWG